jgi:hypothetical protein
MRKYEFNGVSDEDVLCAAKLFVTKVRDGGMRLEDAIRLMLWDFASSRWHDAGVQHPDSTRTVLALDNRGKPWLATYEPNYYDDLYAGEPELRATCCPPKDAPLRNWQLQGLCNGEGLSITEWREIDEPNV